MEVTSNWGKLVMRRERFKVKALPREFSCVVDPNPSAQSAFRLVLPVVLERHMYRSPDITPRETKPRTLAAIARFKDAAFHQNCFFWWKAWGMDSAGQLFIACARPMVHMPFVIASGF